MLDLKSLSSARVEPVRPAEATVGVARGSTPVQTSFLEVLRRSMSETVGPSSDFKLAQSSPASRTTQQPSGDLWTGRSMDLAVALTCIQAHRLPAQKAAQWTEMWAREEMEQRDGADGHAIALERTHFPAAAEQDDAYPALEGFAEQVRQWAVKCAGELSGLIAEALDGGALSLNQFLTLSYRRLEMGASDRPTYATSWDRLLEEEVGCLLDRYMAMDGRLRDVSAPDLNGYHFTHNFRRRRGCTGISRLDLEQRAKEIVDHPAALQAARACLRGWAWVPRMATRSQFLAAGVDPDQQLPGGAYLFESSPTGDSSLLAVPVYVRGYRYGSVVMEFPTQ